MMPPDDQPMVASGPGHAVALSPAKLGTNAMRLTVRRRQRLSLAEARPREMLVLESGCLTIDAILPDGRRQILMVLYPGDVLANDIVPSAPLVTITAALPSTLLRSRPGEIGDDGRARPSTARQLARSGLHAMTLGRLTGEERVATALIEMALFLGRQIAGGYAVELPLSRRDLADYLALNPDTLSRIVSRMKARKLISTPGRRHLIITDFTGLAALSPLAGALHQLRNRDAEAQLSL